MSVLQASPLSADLCTPRKHSPETRAPNTPLRALTKEPGRYHDTAVMIFPLETIEPDSCTLTRHARKTQNNKNTKAWPLPFPAALACALAAGVASILL